MANSPEETTDEVVIVPEPVIVAAPMPRLVRKRFAHVSNYSQVRRRKTLFIVVHATDGHEGPRKDDDVAAMFAKPLPPGSARSCTWVVDTDSFTQCVPDGCTAWHCGRTANRISEGIEFCGRANQSRAQWFDALSFPMLCLGARLIAWRAKVLGLPIDFIDADGLRAGQSGITTHAEVSKAWRESKHTDPGPHFPISELLSAARRAT